MIKQRSLEKSTALSPASESDILRVVPNLPTFSSGGAGWKGLCASYCHQPTHETPEFFLAEHTIHLHAGHSNTVKLLAEDGCLQDGLQQSGDIGISPAHQPQKMRWQGDVEFIHLYLDPAFMQQVVFESTTGQEIELKPQLGTKDPLIQGLGLSLMSELKSNKEGSRLYAETAGTLLSVHLLRHYTVHKQVIQEYTGGLSRYRLQQVIDYINDYLHHNLSLTELASLVHISPYHFARLFKQSTGMPPHQYVTNCRIERAKQLLAKKELSIIEITQQVGFQSQSHFTTLFRRFLRTTPRDYRNSL